MGWRDRPTFAKNFPKEIDYIIFIDESGDTSYKHINKCINKGVEVDKANRFFTISGCAIKREDFPKIKDDITKLKYLHWEGGLFKYKGKHEKRVCFHSTEIRGNKEAFAKNVIDCNSFIVDLSNFMSNLNMTIFSSTLDKEHLARKYTTPAHPYNMCLEFILERFVKYFAKQDENCWVVLEARGKKEDKFILDFMKDFIDNGNQYTTSRQAQKIKGVYFNPKWCAESNNKKSYFGLEITDLINFPIHKYCREGIKDKAFKSIESKIYKYPNYDGKGIKIFPNK